MEIIRKIKLLKLKKKNLGNVKLARSIDKLISTIENSKWKSKSEILATRKDADCVHNDGFYFFNINVHRTMIMILFEEDEASITWVGSHDEYNKTFRNNKNTIESWLRSQGKIK